MAELRSMRPCNMRIIFAKIHRVFAFPRPRPELWLSAPYLYFMALAHNLYLPALALNLCLPVLRFTVKVCYSYSVYLYKLSV